MNTKKTGHTHSISGAGGAHTMYSMFGARGPLLGPADGAGGGAGAAGAGGGTGAAAGAGAAGAGGEGGEGALGEAAKLEVANMVNAAVNGAVTQHLGKFKKQFTEEITATLGSSLNPISEQLKAMAEASKVQQQGQQARAGEPAALPVEVQNSLKRYEDRIKELEQQNKAEREARELEKSTRLRDEERTTLANALRGAGLPDTAIKAAVAMLHTEDKRVARTEDGKIIFKIPKGTGNAAYVDELPVEAGVTEWLKSDEGKSLLPARPAQGAGGQAARPGQGPRNKNEAREAAVGDLAKMLLNG